MKTSFRRVAAAAAALGLLATLAAAIFAPTRLHAQADVLSGILQRLPKLGAYPPNATPLVASSGNVTNATASATLTSASGVTTYIFGFDVYGTGATAASVVNCTITGTGASNTPTYAQAVPAGATTAITPTIVRFPEPIPASAANTTIVVSCPAFGSGNTNASVNAYGFTTALSP